jgi:hypothetical protein
MSMPVQAVEKEGKRRQLSGWGPIFAFLLALVTLFEKFGARIEPPTILCHELIPIYYTC